MRALNLISQQSRAAFIVFCARGNEFSSSLLSPAQGKQTRITINTHPPWIHIWRQQIISAVAIKFYITAICSHQSRSRGKDFRESLPDQDVYLEWL